MVKNSFCQKVIMKDLTKKNIKRLKQSSTLVINEKCKQLIKQGKKVYQFGFGQSPFPVPEEIVDALKNNAHRKEYLPIQGLIKLRETISKNLKNKTGINYPKENIVITTPTATIGVRGTSFTTSVDELGRSLVILLPETECTVDGDCSPSGEITVTNEGGVVV